MTHALPTTRSPLAVLALAALAATGLVHGAHAEDGRERIAAAAKVIEPEVIEWRRDFHQNPELGNRELRTAAKVAGHLRSLGIEVTTGVAHTGVVGILRGGKPGPVVALRADMDALPVTEKVDVPFASHVTAEYAGQQVGVMHACGHDNHVAILMGAAEVLAGMREDLPGTVKLIFQPAEEGPPPGERGGAALMIAEGVLENPKPDAIFGLHVGPKPSGLLGYRPEGAMAAADALSIVVEGRQTHGSSPWMGVDPVIVSAQIMTALQLIPSRQLDVTRAPAVVTIGSIHGGVRGNIIPETVEMTGTIRTFDTAMREDLLERIRRTAERIAESAGARATVTIDAYAPVVHNDPELTRRMIPTLDWAAGGRVAEQPRIMGAEDFAFFQEKIPGFYFWLGVNEDGVGAGEAAPNHSPYFFANEDALIVGVRAMAGVAWDYLNGR
ncbi:MAG TPA: amidohydrolase [Thermoanaerobaculia bacterium]|nr:amidohydrolase [Thermoanaerobaculia bacterium]